MISGGGNNSRICRQAGLPGKAGLFVLAALLAAAALLAGGHAAQASPMLRPYLNFSVSTDNLDLGTAPAQGAYDSTAELVVHITANYLHGGLFASMTAMKHESGNESIGTDRIFMRLPHTGNYMSLAGPISVTGPMNPGVFNVPLRFRVITTMADTPGKYTGTLTLTVAPQP